MATESIAAKAFIGDILKAYAPLVALVGSRVYDSRAPVEATYPHVIFQYMTGADYSSGENVFASEPRFTVKGVDRAEDSETAGDIAGHIFDALKTQKVNVVLGAQTYFVASPVRLMPVDYVEVSGDETYYHVGGIYRFFVERLS